MHWSPEVKLLFVPFVILLSSRVGRGVMLALTIS